MLDNAWLDGALELHKKMKEMADHSWHFDKSWLDKVMEMQKMIPGPGINSTWYQELLGSIMKGYPGSGFFNAQESGAQPDDTAAVEQASSNRRPHSREWQPQFTITETNSLVTLTAYIPGIKNKEDVSIRLDGSKLIIAGRNTRFPGGQGQDGQAEEFYREIRLPADGRSDGTTAYYTNGSLTIKIPKSKPASIDLTFSQ
ncbi:MAG: Hsp20/alpha crystallin family protein [Thermacetogeniaceae bacterium]